MKAQNQTKKNVQTSQVKKKNVQKTPKSIAERIENLLNYKSVTVIMLAILSMAFFNNYSAIFDKKVNLNGDNIVYYSCGKAIAAGKGFTNTMGFEETPHTHFPPGYPLLIAGIQKVQPNDILVVKKVNGVLLWLSLLLLFLLIRKITKNTPVAFCATLFTAMQSSILFFATIMMSEMLYIFILMIIMHLAIYLNEKLFIKKSSWQSIVLFVLFLLNIIYIYLVRSVGLAMALTAICWFGFLAVQNFIQYLKEKRKNAETNSLPVLKSFLLQRIMICLLVTVSFFTVYKLWNIRQVNSGMADGSSYKGVFLRKTGGETMKTLDDWKERLKYNISGNITKWLPNKLYGTPYDNDAKITGGQWTKGLLTLLIFTAGLFYLRKDTFWLLLFYLGSSMVIVVMFPEQYQDGRYLTPLMPFFIFLFFNGIANIVKWICRLLPKKPQPLILQTVVLFCICTFWFYPDYVKAQEQLRETAKIKSWEKYNDPRMHNYLEACKFCKNNLPDSSRVITRKQEIFYMFSGYKKSESFPWYAEPDSVISYLKSQHATHVILDDWFRHAYVTLYPAVRNYPDKFKVLTVIGQVDTTTKQNPTYVLEFNDEWGYRGEYANGVKSGEGAELFQDGRKYVGHYENDLPNGYGVLYDAAGNVISKGKWRNGMFAGQ